MRKVQSELCYGLGSVFESGPMTDSVVHWFVTSVVIDLVRNCQLMRGWTLRLLLLLEAG